MLIYFCVYDKEKQPDILEVMSPNGFRLHTVHLVMCLPECGGDMQFLCKQKGYSGRAFLSTIHRNDKQEFCVENNGELVPLIELQEIYAIADRWNSFRDLVNPKE